MILLNANVALEAARSDTTQADTVYIMMTHMAKSIIMAAKVFVLGPGRLWDQDPVEVAVRVQNVIKWVELALSVTPPLATGTTVCLRTMRIAFNISTPVDAELGCVQQLLINKQC